MTVPDVPQEAVDAALGHVRSQPLLWQYVTERDVRAILEAAAQADGTRLEVEASANAAAPLRRLLADITTWLGVPES